MFFPGYSLEWETGGGSFAHTFKCAKLKVNARTGARDTTNKGGECLSVEREVSFFFFSTRFIFSLVRQITHRHIHKDLSRCLVWTLLNPQDDISGIQKKSW